MVPLIPVTSDSDYVLVVVSCAVAAFVLCLVVLRAIRRNGY